VTRRPLVLTPGEPAGIGPDLLVSLCQQDLDTGLVVITDPNLLLDRARQLHREIRIIPYDPHNPPLQHSPGTLIVLPALLNTPVTPGHPSADNASSVLATIDRAVDGCLAGEFSAMVTGPVHKSVINDAGYRFSGHTEYIAERCNNAFPVMMLMNQTLRVALVTTHLPLSRVAETITRELVETVITTVERDLRNWFRIEKPRLLVCGLNPHAGENGYLGREEIERIEPVIHKLRHQGMNIRGPVPADTAFTPESLKQADVVISMFHDQGLPVLKSLGFGETVNITLGLPIIRTSVDHGTALDLAGTGRAHAGSLLAAIQSAASLVTRN
jgi:4-hydroxythreonine-4-phosphate dehydrogenase